LAAEQIPGEGSTRFVAAVRRYCETAIGDQAFLQFLRREPDTTLRVVMSRRGPVVQRIADVIERLLDELHPPAGGASNRELAELMVQVATALVSGAFAIGDEPDTDRAVRVVRALLEADESVRSRR
jgi:hypothetical protein